MINSSIRAIGRLIGRTMCAVLLTAGSLLAQSPIGTDVAAPARFVLLRCGPQRDASCLASRIALSPDAAFGGEGALAPQWRAQLAGVLMSGASQPRVAGATQPDVTPLFGVPVLSATSLGRAVLLGTVELLTSTGSIIHLRASWRPPLISLPAFAGTADSTSLPPAIREALSIGAEPAGVRPALLMLLALTGLLLVVFVPRFLWTGDRESDEDLAQQVAA
ncbi:MAG: hypothetical protein ABMA00_10585, partial [Gemmatimonas sp.]